MRRAKLIAGRISRVRESGIYDDDGSDRMEDEPVKNELTYPRNFVGICVTLFYAEAQCNVLGMTLLLLSPCIYCFVILLCLFSHV